jgi:hydroxymethylpyrimidine/phosphomethylpyrimidine kinase
MKSGIPRALTIAGSDSGGGAGIQADIKTFTAHRVYGMSVITSVTAQNTKSVMGIFDIDPDFVGLQIDAVLSDIGTDAAKTGMLSNAEIIKTVSRKLREYNVEKLVVDPVMRSKSGDALLQKDAERSLVEEILPLAYVVTPNICEAEALAGIEIRGKSSMRECARAIWRLGARCVIVKGGHTTWSQEATDILFDGKDFYEFTDDMIDTPNTHGTGCTYSAAICANLALGLDLIAAVEKAKEYVTEAIKRSFSIGCGHGPLNHFWASENI